VPFSSDQIAISNQPRPRMQAVLSRNSVPHSAGKRTRRSRRPRRPRQRSGCASRATAAIRTAARHAWS